MTTEENHSTQQDDARVEVLQQLENELRMKADRVRTAQLPQKVGMAAAAKMAAERLPQHLTALVQAQVSDGRLAKQLKAMKKRAEGDEVEDEAGLALAAILIGQAALVGEWLARMAANNEADAHRLEGQAVALENEAATMATRIAKASSNGGAPEHRESGERPEPVAGKRRRPDEDEGSTAHAHA